MVQVWTSRAKKISQTGRDRHRRRVRPASIGWTRLSNTHGNLGRSRVQAGRSGLCQKAAGRQPADRRADEGNRSHVAAVDWDKDTLLSEGQPGPDRLRIVM